MRSLTLGAGVLLGLMMGPGAAAQDRQEPPRIDVLAVGSVDLPPEIATIRYTVRGEGQTAEEATKMLVSRKQATEAALNQFSDTRLDLHTGTMRVQEVRSADCRRGDMGARLSTGSCAIQGYVVEMLVTVTIAPVARAGTLTGAVAQAGGSEVNLASFGLRDLPAARRKAMAVAFANGKAQAEAIAAASGAKLGPLLRVTDGDMRDSPLARDIGALSLASSEGIVVTGSSIPVGINPDKVTITARLNLSYEIVR